MKTFTIFFALLVTFQLAQAAVHTVNNNNPSPGQFATLQAAVNAATAGDTIYIHVRQIIINWPNWLNS
jgi:CTP:molybdopterin cytidylyltransferase MocA